MTKKEVLENIDKLAFVDLPGVYLITRKSDGKPYIGQSSGPIAKRLKAHITNPSIDKNKTGIDYAIKTEGFDKFDYEVLMPLPKADIDQLNFTEAYYIEKYSAKDNGFNKTAGNHKGDFSKVVKERSKYEVQLKLTKAAESKFKLNLENKRVLLIHNFNNDFISYLKYRGCDIIIIDKYTNDKIEFLDYFNESLNNMENKKFDYVIANPPYGDIGDKITQRVIDEIEYDRFINILPLKDYSLDSANHINMNNIHICQPHSFGDADILTHIVEVSKDKLNYFNDKIDYCVASFFIDKPMLKLMKANARRYHYAISNTRIFRLGYDVNCTFVYHNFDLTSAHTCGMPPLDSDKAAVKNEYNLNNNIILNENNKILGVNMAIVFNTPEEKNNFIKFYKENLNFINRMIAIPFFTVRDKAACWPKVDWTREWTLEELLKDFDYTDDEIEEVMVTMNVDYRVKNADDLERYL